jgi:hypothetical protein
VGAIIGAIGGLLVQNIAYPAALQQISKWRDRRRIKKINSAWQSLQDIVPVLKLFQAGWLPDGTFGPDQVRMRLLGAFQLSHEIDVEIRQKHAPEWAMAGLTDGEQVGIRSLQIYRISDEPTAEREGRAHMIEILTHSYHYFDFLATHRLLVTGTPDERALLSKYAGKPNPEDSIAAFPNPLSVGLSLFCESGNVLALLVRSKMSASGGYWHGGKVFNAVGENATPHDFRASFEGHMESSPFRVAKRGLFQEMGFSQTECETAHVVLHSLAWAADIRDHKFFGYLITPMAVSEIRYRWEHAADRAENREIHFVGLSSRDACRRFWSEIVSDTSEWAPEALLCTMRSLLVLGKLSPEDLLRLSHRRRHHR